MLIVESCGIACGNVFKLSAQPIQSLSTFHFQLLTKKINLPSHKSGRKAFLPRYHPHSPEFRRSFKSADTLATHNGVTRRPLLLLQGAAHGRKPGIAHTQFPPNLRSLKCKPIQGGPIFAFAIYKWNVSIFI